MGRLIALLLPCFLSAVAVADCRPWPAWVAFRQAYVQADGRVIDRSLPDQPTVSEASAYAAFLALVADDRPTFYAIERWVLANLAAGDLGARLPAWRWGHRDDGHWDVIDANSASDADLWLAYDFLEAGRLWGDTRLSALARQLAMRILDEEVVRLDKVGLILLPGPKGFLREGNRAVVNPSYAPPFVLSRLATIDSRYLELADSHEQLLKNSIGYGFVPDWAEAVAGVGYQPIVGEDGRGSYNAIRVYLWLALSADSPARRRAIEWLRPFVEQVPSDHLPEWFDPRTGLSGGVGGRAHIAALLPFLKIVAPARYAALRAQMNDEASIAPDGQRYYGDVLTLIALAADTGRYRFTLDGRLLRGRVPCHS